MTGRRAEKLRQVARMLKDVKELSQLEMLYAFLEGAEPSLIRQTTALVRLEISNRKVSRSTNIDATKELVR